MGFLKDMIEEAKLFWEAGMEKDVPEKTAPWLTSFVREDINPYLEHLQEEMGPIDPMMGLGMTKRSLLKTLGKIRDPMTGQVLERLEAVPPNLRSFILNLPGRAVRGLRQLWQVGRGAIPKGPELGGVYLRGGQRVGGLRGPATSMIERGARSLPHELGHHIIESKLQRNPSLRGLLESRFRDIRNRRGPLADIFEPDRFSSADEFWGKELGEVLSGEGGSYSGSEILDLLGVLK